jgi:hypothetical protein
MYRRLVWVKRDRLFPGACHLALSTGLSEPRSSKQERGFFFVGGDGCGLLPH